MAFATETELGDFLQGTVASPTAALALDIATSVIQSATGQTLSLVTDDVITVRGDSGIVTLPQWPVVSVGAVTTAWWGDASTTPATVNVDYARRGNELRWIAGGYRRAGSNPKWGVYGSDWPELVTVTYTHGYATIPADIKGCCLMLAAELYSSPDGIGYESIEDYAWRRDDAGQTPASVALKNLVRAYGMRTASVRVG